MTEATLEQRMTVLEQTVRELQEAKFANFKRRSTLESQPRIGWTA